MNKNILIAIDKESFTKDELKKNKESAYDVDDVDDVDYWIDYWIDMYFKKTGENKQDYIDEIKRVKESVKEETLEYTQDMADNGVLPSVGMYVEAYKDRVVEIMLPFDPTRFTVGKCKDGEYALYSIGELKPLTPPITLVHGKAYQFDIRPQYGNTNGIQGIYSEKLRVFQSSGNGFHEETVENIQPLTVEVK